MILEFLASYCHLAILLLQLTFVLNKNKIFQGFHLSTLYTIIIYYYIYYYHNLNNNDNYLNPTTYVTNKNQYFLFYLFSENTTRRPWHWITNRAQQDQPYSNESLEIQTHNHLLKDNSRQSEVLCGYYGNQKKILRFLWNFGMSADITLAGHRLGKLRKLIPKFTPLEGRGHTLTLAGHRLGKLRKLIPKFTPPEGRGHTLTYETLTYQFQLLCKFCKGGTAPLTNIQHVLCSISKIINTFLKK